MRCQKANVVCEGYSIKLRWSGASKQDKVLFRRRNVDFVEYPPDMIYETYQEMDDTLAKLHSPSFKSDETIALGPFAVFKGFQREKLRDVRSESSPEMIDFSSTQSGRKIALKHQNTFLLNSAKRTLKSTEGIQTQSTLNIRNSGSPSDNSHSPQTNSTTHTTPTGIPEIDEINIPNFVSQDEKMEYDMLHDELSALLAADSSSFMGLLNPSQQPMESSNSPLFSVMPLPPLQYYLSTDGKYGLPTNSLHFNYESRYLLDHYVRKVAPIMTVIAHPQSPWKSIHIPRVVVAIGDLVATGKTTSARNALLNAILAVSAFHLQREFLQNSDAQTHYLNFGLQLKAEAYKWLTESLMNDLGNQKYKDVVAAVLSMVSIDIIRGSMEDTPIHLAACQSIVKMRYRKRPKMSQRAVVLHRISGFMTLMQGATALDPTSTQDLGHTDLAKEDYDTAEQWMDLRFEDLGLNLAQAVDLVSPHAATTNEFGDDGFSLSHMIEPSQFSEYWGQYTTENAIQWSDDFYSKELTSAQALHGIPDSLTVIFRLTCKLARKAVSCRTKGEPLPKSFSAECSDLESALVSWQNQYDMNRNNDLQGRMKQAFNHHTLSFHQTLTIYHYRITRGVNSLSLQENVKNVIDHLEQMQKLNDEEPDDPIITPLLFQGFVAACELDITKEHMKARFEKWLNDMSKSGLGGFLSAQEVVWEVWRRRANGEPQPDWWKIVADWKLNLMLM